MGRILIKNGRLVDPANGRDEVCDILICGDEIKKIGSGLSEEDAVLIDAEGNPYMPGEDNSVQYLQYTYRDTGELAFTAHQGGITEEQLREALEEMGVKSND